MTQRRTLLAGALACLTLAAGCGGGDKPQAAQTPTTTVSPTPAKHLITGSVLLGAGGTIRQQDFCLPERGYRDIREGAVVTVTDGTGSVIALGKLIGFGKLDGTGCRFDMEPMTVPEVPFYGVEVASRGVVRFTLADMQTNKFSVRLTLG